MEHFCVTVNKKWKEIKSKLKLSQFGVTSLRIEKLFWIHTSTQHIIVLDPQQRKNISDFGNNTFYSTLKVFKTFMTFTPVASPSI